MRRVAVSSVLLFSAAVSFASPTPDEVVAIELSGALPFMREAEAAYVVPVKNPMKPRRNDKHLRLLGPEAVRPVVQVLTEKRNMCTLGREALRKWLLPLGNEHRRLDNTFHSIPFRHYM